MFIVVGVSPELPIVRPGIVYRDHNAGEIVRAVQADRLVAG